MIQTFHTPEPVIAEIRNAAGHVTVDLSADITETTVTVEQLPGVGGFVSDLVATLRNQPTGSADGPDPTQDVRVDLRLTETGSTVVMVDTDPARIGWKSSFAVTVTAPARSGVRAQTQSADIRVVGAADRLDVRTASGDVAVGTVERGSLVQTASGDIRVDEIGADAEFRTASGDITLQRCGGSVSVHSTSGDVRIRRPEHAAFVRSVSGDVELSEVGQGVVELTSVSGDVTIGILPGACARLDLRTVSGRTRNDFEVSDNEPRIGADSSEGDTAALGDELRELSVSCRTTSGNIRLRRTASV